MNRGPVFGGSGAAAPFTGSLSGSQRVNDAHGRFLDSVLGGRQYSLCVSAAAAATAYAGAAAGTPFLAVHNPANSGKIIALSTLSWANAVAASAAGTVVANLYFGPSAQPTGTRTNPTSLLSLTNSGSVAAAFVNTALTGSTALTNILSLGSYYWATAAGAAQVSGPSLIDLGGLILLAPGNQAAFGFSAALTSATWFASLTWEELPFLL